MEVIVSNDANTQAKADKGKSFWKGSEIGKNILCLLSLWVSQYINLLNYN